jgi:F-type H+-transporting ATPase subunit gamma
MPSLIDIRRRIRSVKNTQQITKAMKMVSAAKLRRAQDRVIAARPYATLLRQMIANVVAAVQADSDDEGVSNPLLVVRPEKRIELLLITGEKGLAGAFNANIIKASVKFARDEHPDAVISYALIGRKGRDYYRKRNVVVAGEHVGVLANVLFADASTIAQNAIERFRKEEIDAVYLLNNEFKSVMSQKLTVTRVLPIEISAEQQPIDYIYEQPPAELLAALLPQYVESEVYRAMLESVAAEHAARMTAMDSATSNAADMIESLTLYMNRVRQASITREIIEVVSGASAAG